MRAKQITPTILATVDATVTRESPKFNRSITATKQRTIGTNTINFILTQQFVSGVPQ